MIGSSHLKNVIISGVRYNNIWYYSKNNTYTFISGCLFYNMEMIHTTKYLRYNLTCFSDPTRLLYLYSASHPLLEI